ncbi:helix-turn-helix domain-containing protein [Chondrinema litorale]|uniref:helix-turn-helix domain-containing protein n=1 Tax=Chondrinema litorale TaxID=2994555 RepID=UPI002543C1A9|nr:helix-turn-helix transcriptional regulator [Chondrinema litorale]UZR97209.1 helix-turn-helix transcriptional regulator [Chondrinema litorale]
MENKKLDRYKTISQFHKSRDLPNPDHPLISVIDVKDIRNHYQPINMILDYYSISLKRNFSSKFIYGQNEYDYDDGVMYFISPNQIFKIEHSKDELLKQTGWLLLIHPDFLWNTSLANTIKQYEYFGYSVNEALFLSDKEEGIINNIIQNIKDESHANIDVFTQKIILSHIETLLNYAERFYQRQFITRKKSNHKILERLETLLTDYFNRDDLVINGLPSVQSIAEQLHVSPNYLSGLLKVLTGQSTQQHIQGKLIEKAKEKLSTTDLTVSEIAYILGFEHSQSFSKLFKTKTNLSPLEFRQSFK